MNLHWLPCLQEFGIPLQVVNITRFLNIQRQGLNSNLHFKPRYIDDDTVEALQNTVTTIVTLGVSQPSPLKEISSRGLKRRKALIEIANNRMIPLYNNANYGW
jgi:hypothetical protein